MKSRYLCGHIGRHGNVRCLKRGGHGSVHFEGTTRRPALKGTDTCIKGGPHGSVCLDIGRMMRAETRHKGQSYTCCCVHTRKQGTDACTKRWLGAKAKNQEVKIILVKIYEYSSYVVVSE